MWTPGNRRSNESDVLSESRIGELLMCVEGRRRETAAALIAVIRTVADYVGLPAIDGEREASGVFALCDELQRIIERHFTRVENDLELLARKIAKLRMLDSVTTPPCPTDPLDLINHALGGLGIVGTCTLSGNVGGQWRLEDDTGDVLAQSYSLRGIVDQLKDRQAAAVKGGANG